MSRFARAMMPIALAFGLIAPSVASEVDPAIRQFTDLYARSQLEQMIEDHYWQMSLILFDQYHLVLDDAELETIRDTARAEIPGAYDYVIPPAYAAMAEHFTPEEAAEISAGLKSGGPDKIADPALEERFYTEASDAMNEVMQTELYDLLQQRMGDYRMAAWQAGVANGFIPDGLLGVEPPGE